MDKVTHSIRRKNWIRIIQECHNRPSHMTAKQWLKEHGISSKSYYYWQHKLRAEAAGQMELSLPVAMPADVTFAEVPMTTASSTSAATNSALIKIGDAEIEISEDISDEFLMRIVKVVRHVS